MRVRNLMVCGKLFLLTFANTALAQSPTFDSTASFGITQVIARIAGLHLSKTDLETHRLAVYHALNNLDNGETVEWRSDTADADGKVVIAYTWPASGQICRRIYSTVRVRFDSRNYQDTACLNTNSKTWSFIDKY